VGTTLAFRFPLGRVHANPWNRAVNEGATEWPPSPWRILRTLVATWYTRWPDLPAPVLDSILDALADPPFYRTPETGTGHTRHYLPDLSHLKAETGNTDLTLDPFLTIERDAELLVHWGIDLTAEQREVLAKLAELIPYLGRSESVCEARLIEEDVMPDETWWRPAAVDGSRRTRLLVPTRPLSRSILETTTAGVRKQKRTMPPGTRWVDYAASGAPHSPLKATDRDATKDVTAIRFAIVGPAPLLLTHGVLLADEAHRQVGRKLEEAGIGEDRRRPIMGTRGAASDHRHAHWVPMGGVGADGGSVRGLVIWVPAGLRTDEVRAILGLRRASGKRGGEDGYEIRGFPTVDLLFQAAGSIENVAPELFGRPSRRWRSVTPYLPVRHRAKNEDWEDFIAEDMTAELRYRDRADAEVTRVELSTEMTAMQVNQYRRHRSKERLGQHSRPGVGVMLEFSSPISGPLLLGQLSHFGFGRFAPQELRHSHEDRLRRHITPGQPAPRAFGAGLPNRQVSPCRLTRYRRTP
jgi:CRISPR-associated protein Csb2